MIASAISSGSTTASGTLGGTAVLAGTAPGSTVAGSAMIYEVFMTGGVSTETRAVIKDRTRIELDSPITTTIEYASSF